jgi:hypothetical protein
MVVGPMVVETVEIVLIVDVDNREVKFEPEINVVVLVVEEDEIEEEEVEIDV